MEIAHAGAAERAKIPLLLGLRDVVVRPRTDEDLDACVDLAAMVHASDGYPPYLPGGDFRVLLTQPPALAAYVAIADDRVVGHVALHEASPNDTVTTATNALGCESARLAIVARLFTSPTSRRTGVGRALLEAAASAARARQLVPILDVWVELRGAIALYEACGWANLGTVQARLPDGRVLPEYVFVAP